MRDLCSYGKFISGFQDYFMKCHKRVDKYRVFVTSVSDALIALFLSISAVFFSSTCGNYSTYQQMRKHYCSSKLLRRLN